MSIKTIPQMLRPPVSGVCRFVKMALVAIVSLSAPVFAQANPITHEAENLTMAAISTGDTRSQVAHAGASNGYYDLLTGNAAGDFITYTVNVATAGTYNIKTGVTITKQRGIYQLKIDGVNQGVPQDYYDPSGTVLFDELDLGDVTLSAGNHSFKFECTGKNASATAFKEGLDYVKLTLLADTTPPTAEITDPDDLATVSGTVTVSANAADNVGVAGVQFKLDGADLGGEDTSSPYSISWDTTTTSDATHVLTAVARDAAGNLGTSDGILVTVANGGGGSPVTYEAESLTMAAISTGDTRSQVAHASASNGYYDLLTGNAAGDFITYTVNVAAAGTYNIKTGVTITKQRGIYQLKIDGVNQGSPQDYYDPSGTVLFDELDLGDVTLSAGNHSFRFECTGKNASATAFKMGLDYITLTLVTGGGPPGVPPVVFQDYSARDLAGEAGALAVNDNWANTVYNYVPTHVPNIPAIPTYTGAGNEVIITTRAAFITALNNTSIKKIFVQKGTDMFGGGDITINNLSGTAGAPRWILYYDPQDPNKDLTTIRPWDFAVGSGDRAQVNRLVFTGTSSHYFIIGLNFGKVGFAQERMGIHEDTTNNIVWYRCCSENSSSHSWVVRHAGCHDIWAYQCVSHSHDLGRLQPDNTWVGGPGGDVHCFVVHGGFRVYVVSCEGWDFLGDFWQIGTGSIHEQVCEDSDTYVTEKHYCNADGTPNVNGTHWMGEGPMDIKHSNHNSASIARIWGNRAWGFRRTSSFRHDGGGSSTPVQFSISTLVKRNTDWRWNVFENFVSERAVSFNAANAVVAGGYRSENHSLVRNIFYNFQCSNPVIQSGYHAVEMYLNTFAECHSSHSMFASFFRDSGGGAIDGFDMMGNAFLNVHNGTWGATANLNATGKVGYNLYGGTYTVFNKDYGNDVTYAGGTGLTNLNMGDFRYLRKKLTTPEIAVIPGIVPTSATPQNVRILVPLTGSNQIGSRTGIGVDDEH